MRLDLDTFGEKQFSRELLRVGQNAGDMTPAFDEIHTLFLDVEQRQFGSQGRAFSGGWKPLAASTKARKARLSLDPRILHATLRLRDSLTSESHPDHVYRASADEMFVGTKVPYAGVHQNPKTSPLPRRRPIEFNAPIRTQIVKILQRHLMTGTRNGGAM